MPYMSSISSRKAVHKPVRVSFLFRLSAPTPVQTALNRPLTSIYNPPGPHRSPSSLLFPQTVMDATSILLQLSQSSSPHHQPLHFNYFGDRVADRNSLAAHSSFIRSSAPRQMQQYASQFLPSSFRSTYSMASSSGSSSFVPENSRMGSPYELSDPELRTPAPQTYHTAEQYASAPSSWPQQADQPQVTQYAADPYPSPSYELADGNGMSPPVKAEDASHIESYGSHPCIVQGQKDIYS